jgi:hypothetical protein
VFLWPTKRVFRLQNGYVDFHLSELLGHKSAEKQKKKPPEATSSGV